MCSCPGAYSVDHLDHVTPCKLRTACCAPAQHWSEGGERCRKPGGGVIRRPRNSWQRPRCPSVEARGRCATRWAINGAQLALTAFIFSRSASAPCAILRSDCRESQESLFGFCKLSFGTRMGPAQRPALLCGRTKDATRCKQLPISTVDHCVHTCQSCSSSHKCADREAAAQHRHRLHCLVTPPVVIIMLDTPPLYNKDVVALKPETDTKRGSTQSSSQRDGVGGCSCLQDLVQGGSVSHRQRQRRLHGFRLLRVPCGKVEPCQRVELPAHEHARGRPLQDTSRTRCHSLMTALAPVTYADPTLICATDRAD